MTNRVRRFTYRDELEGPSTYETVASKDPSQLTFAKLVDRLTDDYAAYLFLEELRWPKGPVCPHCHSVADATFLKPRNETGTARATTRGTMSQRRVWKCKGCRKQFSVLTDTIFHGSHVPVRVWVLVMFQMASSKNGMAAKEVQRTYGLAPQTAWHLCHRIRKAMERSAPEMLVGTIVADETWIGGHAKNRKHAGPTEEVATNEPVRIEPGELGTLRAESNPRRNKTPVFALVNVETGEVRSKVVTDVTSATLRKAMAEQVDMAGSDLMTDEGIWYNQIGKEFAAHMTVNHEQDEYVRYQGTRVITTNQAESYFSQLKRSLDGTHHSVSRQHLQRYLHEFDFRYSTRKMTDTQRMAKVIEQADGRRLAYKLCR
ncbi:MAG TPA: IS1595 family transposase [Acidimicrobiales bacterium]|nr:IS1595 family transposase [Acidimicrobiales bacterium]